MQNTAVQMKASSVQSSAPETLSPVNRKKDESEFVDPFMQIVMSILSQPTESVSPQTENTTGAVSTIGADQLSQLTALLQNPQSGLMAVPNLTTNSEPNAQAIINVIAEALASATANNGIMANKGITANNGVIANNGAETTSQTQVSTNLASQISSLLGENVNKADKVTISSETLSQLANVMGLSGKEELKSALKNAGITVAASNSISAQADFSEAVVKAKEMLSENLSQQSSVPDEIDVDKLQNELAKSDATTAFELSLKTSSGTSETSVLDQLKDGIKQNISVGKSEFTIKLRPETLGEITVKLIEEAGKTTLTITTASPATAKLINNDLNALKDAVASMNVEVKNAVVQTNETANSAMQQFDMSGQQFAGQQFAGQRSFYQMTQPVSTQTDNQNSEEVLATLQGAYVKNASSDRLDAYI